MQYESTLIGGGGGVKSVQRGTAVFDVNTATLTVTISSVNTAKALCSYLGTNQSLNLTAVETMNVHMELTNATTLTFTRKNASGAPSVSWEVTEFA